MNTTDVLPLNSRAWWQDYFQHSWDAYGGRGQTAYFMRLLVENLPTAERERLLSDDLSVSGLGSPSGKEWTP